MAKKRGRQRLHRFRAVIRVRDHDSESKARTTDQLNQFFAKHGKNSIAISFLDWFPEAYESHRRCKKWREVFPYQDNFTLWSEAYKRLDRLLPAMPGTLRDHVIEPFYHECVQVLYQGLVLARCREELGVPVCVLVSETFPALREENQGKTIVFYLLRKTVLLAKKKLRRVRAGIRRRVIEPCYRRLQQTPAAKAYYAWQAQRRRVRQWLANANRNTCGIVITVEDSGTMVNLRPALEIIRAFNVRGVYPVVLTSSACVLKELEANKSCYVFEPSHCPGELLAAIRKRFKLPMMLRSVETLLSHTEAEHLFIQALAARTYGAHGYANFTQRVISLMNILQRFNPIQAVLTVYEGLPLSVSAGKWAQQRGIPWIGYFPILVGDRPDGLHFPAPEHLVYGEQLRDLILRHGHPSGSVSIVGTPTYDMFFGRDKTADRRLIRKRFPKVRGKKLVVVATEAFPDPLVELGPVLGSLAGMKKIHVVVKVHPSDSYAFFRKYVNSLCNNGNIDVVKDCNLAALLNSADLLVCIISNIIISAAVLGTPNLVCDFSNKRRVIDFVKEGLSSGCYTPSEVRGAVSRLLFDTAARKEALDKLHRGVRRFNGPNDGRSATRVADHVLKVVAERQRPVNEEEGTHASAKAAVVLKAKGVDGKSVQPQVGTLS